MWSDYIPIGTPNNDGGGEQKGFFWVNEMHRDFFTVCVRFGRMLRKVGIFLGRQILKLGFFW